MTIETNIPVPPHECSGRWKKVLADMNIGDSLVVPKPNERQAVLSCGRHMNLKMTSRKIDGGGFRIWRVG